MFLKKLKSFCIENQTAVLLCLLGFFFYSFISIYRYQHFSYLDWDQALISQSLWDLWHGQLYSSLYGFNVFGDHSSFIDLLILPFYAIFPNPVTISILEIALFSASALLLYYMVSEELDRGTAFLMSFAYLAFTPNFFAMCHDYDPETMAPFFILLTVYFYKKKQIRYFYYSFLFLFLFKENMSLIIAMIGVWGFFSKDRNRMLWGVVPIVLSFAYFILMVKWVIPHFRGMAQHSLWVRYSYLGTNFREVFFNIMNLDNLKIILFNPLNMKYLGSLFGAYFTLVIFSPFILLLCAPIVLYHLLSVHMPEKTIFYYYGAIISPVIFLASVQTLRKFIRSIFLRQFICWILILTGFFQIYAYGPKIPFIIGLNVDPNVSQEWRLIKMVPADAGVVATFRFLPALSLRENLFSFHKIYSEEYHNPQIYTTSDFYNGKVFSLPVAVTYALIDFKDEWLRRSLGSPYVSQRIREFLKGWVPIGAVGSVYLFKRVA